MSELTYELRKCKDCSCSRCVYNGTPGCYVKMAIKELNRYEQAFDEYKKEREFERLKTETRKLANQIKFDNAISAAMNKRE